MQVGILGGTGPLGRGLAARLAASGVTVTIGSRDAARAISTAAELVERWPGRALAVTGADNEGVVASDVVVMATPWEAALSTVVPLAASLAGKVVVSVANALARQGREMHALVPPRGSVAAAVQAAAPEAFVAAAGHHLPAAGLANLDEPVRADVLVCSDHQQATAATTELLGRVPGLRPLDAGSLASAAPIEAFTAVLVSLNMRYRAHSTLGLLGLEA